MFLHGTEKGVTVFFPVLAFSIFCSQTPASIENSVEAGLFLDIRINFWYKVKSYQQIGEIRKGSKNNNEKKYHNKQQKVYF